MIGELISESSSNVDRQSEGILGPQFATIDVGVKGNKLHAQIDDEDFPFINDDLDPPSDALSDALSE